MANHYETLKVSSCATLADIRRAYHRLVHMPAHPARWPVRQRVATPLADAQGGGARSAQVILHHPDKSGDDAPSTAAADAFQAIQRAWEVLKVKARPMRPTQWTRYCRRSLPLCCSRRLVVPASDGGSHYISHPPTATHRLSTGREGTVGGEHGRRADGCGR
jgi:hypothetical protein